MEATLAVVLPGIPKVGVSSEARKLDGRKGYLKVDMSAVKDHLH